MAHCSDPMDEDWMKLDKSPAPEPARAFTRRKKLLHLDDLLADCAKEKLEKEKEKKRKLKSIQSLSDDEGDEENGAQLTDLIEKCTAQVGSSHEIKEAPTWGERVFYSQNACGYSSSASDTTSSSPRVFPAIDPNEEKEFIRDSVLNFVVTTRGCFDRPEFLGYIFKELVCSQDLNLQRDACAALRKHFLTEQKNAAVNWKPTVADIREALGSFGYRDQPVDVVEAGDEQPGSTRDIVWLFSCFLVFCEARLFQDSEIEELLPLFFRCLLDRNCVRRYHLIHECIKELLNHVSPSSIPKIASSLARLNPELVNLYHVLKLLRGDEAKVDALKREVAFELLSDMNSRKLNRCASDVISDMDEFDPKAEVDFVRLYHQLCLADLWLRKDPAFRPGDEAFASWLQILRSFSVRIYCGDYRPFANEVRNRAAFLMSSYSMRTPR